MSGLAHSSSFSGGPPPQSVTIRTGGRLHFGPLSYRPQSGRHFGGIGLMLDSPLLELRATTCRSESTSHEVEAVLDRVWERLPGVTQQARPSIEIVSNLPQHVGLGSGTQLGLSVAEAVARLLGQSPQLQDLLALSGRGKRSGIGAFGYELGGFLVDAGHSADSPLPGLACRTEYPVEWPILLITPREERGLSGMREEQQFALLPLMEEAVTGKLCRLVLTEILPALQTRDFPAFAAAMTAYGHIAGEFFSPLQGGEYASEQIRRLSGKLSGKDLPPLLQSSWGPTSALLCSSVEQAEGYLQKIQSGDPGSHLQLTLTRARNAGRELVAE